MYSMKKVSEMLGIPAVTIRAWETRYRIIAPDRSMGGHRLYSDEDIRTLQWLKDQTQNHNMKISEAVRLLQRQDPEAGAAVEPTGSQEPGGEQYGEWGNKLYDRLIRFQTAEAHETADMIFTLFEFEEAFHRVLAPVMIRVGSEWEAGHITVAQEHYASEFMLLRFHAFLRILPVRESLPKVLCFCPEGELHQLGLMLFGLFLRKRGIEVVYLGPNTPYEGIADLMIESRINAVAVSVTDASRIAALEHWLAKMLRQFPALTPVLGGQGFSRYNGPLSPYVCNGERAAWEEWLRLKLNRRGMRLA
jgi:MerR family transcriptional regulator, light-induced transcriptional regulator